MKSTTLRRSNITREKVAMMEALNRYNRAHQDEDFYKTQTKNKELDALWQSFGVKSQKNEKAPQVYFVTGLIVGVIITLLITTFVSLLINVSTPKEEMVVPAKKPAAATSSRFSFIPADNTSSKKAYDVAIVCLSLNIVTFLFSKKNASIITILATSKLLFKY